MDNAFDRFRKRFSMPHTYVLLFSIMVLMAVLTWVIPAGEFERMVIEGRTVVVPDSYHVVESNPQGIFDILKAVPQGLAEVQNISFFIFITGGSFALITATGMIEAVIGKIITILEGKEAVVIPIVMLAFAVGGATIGLSEETIVFVAIGIALARGLGYDALVGMSMISIGSAIGFTSGFMNPFTVGIAQEIAELPLFSGIGLRLVLLFLLWVISSWYIVRYARKVKKDPEKSMVYDLEQKRRKRVQSPDYEETDAVQPLTGRHMIVLLVFVLGFILIAFGVFQYGWFITEIGAVFLGMGLLAGFIGGMSPNEVAATFLDGAKDLVFAALVVGLARGVLVIMENGLILDTIVYALTSVIGSLPTVLSVIGMYFVQVIVNLFIPSGSGQAAATMPIMVPLADTLGISRQTTVLAFQLGDGFTNSIIPTAGTLMAQLSIAKISYGKWSKFILPLIGIWLVIGIAFMLFAHYAGYGPF